MIVTKPGDVRLINLTRELALYLITTPRFGRDRGVTVYVDKNLKDSKRFDFSGMLKSSPLVKDYLKFWTQELCVSRVYLWFQGYDLGVGGSVARARAAKVSIRLIHSNCTGYRTDSCVSLETAVQSPSFINNIVKFFFVLSIKDSALLEASEDED